MPRPTYDVDITVSIDRSRLPDLFDAVESLGYSVPGQYRTGWVDRVAEMPPIKFRVFLQDHGVDVDLFLAETPFQDQLLARRIEGRVNGFTVWLVSPEDLILLKLLASRPRDLSDIGDILFTQGDLDESYLRKTAASLKILDPLQQVLDEHHRQ
jgi:hypothetical protein